MRHGLGRSRLYPPCWLVPSHPAPRCARPWLYLMPWRAVCPGAPLGTWLGRRGTSGMSDGSAEAVTVCAQTGGVVSAGPQSGESIHLPCNIQFPDAGIRPRFAVDLENTRYCGLVSGSCVCAEFAQSLVNTGR